MHTFEGPSGTRFSYNSDESGEVIIRSGDNVIKFQMVDLTMFSDHLKQRHIERMLEGADPLIRNVFLDHVTTLADLKKLLPKSQPPPRD